MSKTSETTIFLKKAKNNINSITQSIALDSKEYKLSFKSGMYLSHTEVKQLELYNKNKYKSKEINYHINIIHADHVMKDMFSVFESMFSQAQFKNFYFDEMTPKEKTIAILFEADYRCIYDILHEAEKGMFIIPIINIFDITNDFSYFEMLRYHYLLLKLQEIIINSGFSGSLSRPLYNNKFANKNNTHYEEYLGKPFILKSATLLFNHLYEFGSHIKEIHVCETKNGPHNDYNINKIIKNMNDLYKLSTKIRMEMCNRKICVPPLKFPFRHKTEEDLQNLIKNSYMKDFIQCNNFYPVVEHTIELLTSIETKENFLVIRDNQTVERSQFLVIIALL